MKVIYVVSDYEWEDEIIKEKEYAARSVIPELYFQKGDFVCVNNKKYKFSRKEFKEIKKRFGSQECTDYEWVIYLM